jgi:hypothetical protein
MFERFVGTMALILCLNLLGCHSAAKPPKVSEPPREKGGGGAPAPVESVEGDETTSATTTYIESGPLGFLKLVEIREMAKSENARAKEKNSTLLVSFLPLVDFMDIRTDSSRFVEFGFLKIPFIKGGNFRHVEGTNDVRAAYNAMARETNPFSLVESKGDSLFVEQPLFCLYDYAKIRPNMTKAEKKTASQEEARRLRILDTLPVSLYQDDRWLDGQYRRTWLDTMVFSAYLRESSKQKSELGILHGAFWASAFHYEDNKQKDFFSWQALSFISGMAKVAYHKDEKISGCKEATRKSDGDIEEWEGRKTDTQILYTFLASVYEREQVAGKLDEWTFLAAPLTSLVHSKQTEKGSEFWLLSTSNANSGMSSWRKGPLVALWYQSKGNAGEKKTLAGNNDNDKIGTAQAEAGETSTFQFLRLPILGPLWAAWGNPEATHWGLFPRLFFRSSFEY